MPDPDAPERADWWTEYERLRFELERAVARISYANGTRESLEADERAARAALDEHVRAAIDALEDLTARYLDAQSEADRLAIHPPSPPKISDSLASPDDRWLARIAYLERALPPMTLHRWGGDAREIVAGIDAAMARRDRWLARLGPELFELEVGDAT